jgi:predicted DNA-binding transcriptional regulator AlpA
MDDQQSPLIKVSQASKQILLEKPPATYEKIRLNVFPPGVVVRLGERSIRFHRENLLKWLATGGCQGNGSCDEQRAA